MDIFKMAIINYLQACGESTPGSSAICQSKRFTYANNFPEALPLCKNNKKNDCVHFTLPAYLYTILLLAVIAFPRLL